MRSIARKRSSASLGAKSFSPHGHAAPPDGCPKGRSTAPAGCAAGSRMMNPRSGIGERPWMPPSSCWKSCNFSHEKTLPGRDWQTLAAPGQEAFLTPYLTTVKAGTRGNSGLRAQKISDSEQKAPENTINHHKNLVQAFERNRPDSPTTSHRGVAQLVARLLCRSPPAAPAPEPRSSRSQHSVR